MLVYTVFMLSVVLTVQGVTEDGFTSRCYSNITLFVQKGKEATFYVDSDRMFMSFYRGILVREELLHFEFGLISDVDDRLNITFMGRNHINAIILHNVVMEDTGVYMFIGRTTICWELFVLDIWNAQGSQTFEEFRPAYIHASPPASRLVLPRVNATSTWLLNGLNYSQTTAFQEKDGQILIFSMLRNLDGNTVTYRIVEDNGTMHDVNLTLSVTYGPVSALHFSALKTNYFMTSGDVMPDILCFTDCNPVCKITWDRSGVGNVLSVGQVDLSSNGLYTCRATRNGSDVVVERSIYVEVTDNTSFIIAVAVLGTMQGMTMVCLGVCAVCMYMTYGRNGTCMSCIKKRDSDKTHDNMTSQRVYEQDISSVEMANYEGLDNTQSGTNEVYESLNIDTVASPM